MLDGETYIDDNEHEKFMQDDEYLNQDQLLDQLVREIHDDDEKLPPRVIRSRMAQQPAAIDTNHYTDATSTAKAITSLPPKAVKFTTIEHQQIPSISKQEDFSFNFDNLDQDLKHSKAKRLHLDDALMSQIKNLKIEHEQLKNINKQYKQRQQQLEK
jgi:DNA gyrase/topoisomerase IV subunit A